MEDRFKRFTVLIDAGTYTSAARQLHTSQPALTTAIQKLARELKGELLVPGSRTLKLTPLGKVAYQHGKLLITAEKNLKNQVTNLAERKQALHIGCIDSVANIIAQDELLSILERDSEISLNVQNSKILLKELQTGVLDMAIVVDQGEQPSGTEERFLGNERFVLVCAKDKLEDFHQAYRQKLLPDFLAYNRESTTFELIHTQLHDNKVGFEPRLYSTNPAVLLQLALQGKGIAALPVSLVASHMGSELAEIELKKPLQRPIIALWQGGHHLPESVEDFLDATEVQLV